VKATTGGFKGRGGNRLLSALSTKAFGALKSNLKRVSLKQGYVLQEPGDKINYLYFPHVGMISLLAVMKNGKAIETATVGREGAVGIMSAMSRQCAFCRVVVQTPVEASRIATAHFQKALASSVEIRNTAVRYVETLMAQVQQTAACNALHEIDARLCRWLLQTHDRTDGDIIPLTQEFLSEMLGVTRTTVTLVARQLQKAGAISYRRGKIEIINRRALERRACECYEVIRKLAEP